MQIVTTNLNGQPVTTSLAIAHATETNHANVLKTILNHIADLEALGVLRVEKEPFETAGGTQKRKVAYLNPPQTAFLLSRFRAVETSRAIGALVKSLPDQYQGSIVQLVEQMDISELDADMYIYVVREVETDRVKIGISRNPERRIKELQVGNSQELELIATRKADHGFADEASLHRLFDADRIRGEWFTSSAQGALQ